MPHPLKLAALLLFLLFVSQVGVAAESRSASVPNKPAPSKSSSPDLGLLSLSKKNSYGDYEVRLYTDDAGGGALEILKGGKQVFVKDGGRFNLGSLYEDEKKTGRLPIGKNITGNGIPNLVVSEWSGGAHCCLTVNVFEIGNEFKQIGELQANDADLSDFVDLDGDSNLEFETADTAFAYFETSFAGSYFPKVILHYDNGGYHFARNLMRLNAPADKDLLTCAVKFHQSRQRKANGSGSEVSPPYVLPMVLDLIYSGNALQAWKFIDMAWPEKTPEKTKWLKELHERLHGSPYSLEVQLLNGTPAANAKVFNWADRCERNVVEGR